MFYSGNGIEEVEYRPLPGVPTTGSPSGTNESKRKEVSFLQPEFQLTHGCRD
jgi:hypothetical protein